MQKIRSIAIAFVIAFSLIGTRMATVQAQAQEQILAPLSYTTLRGSSGGQPVSVLGVLEQTGTDDNPATYVSFITSRVAYRGTQTFQLPDGVNRSSISALKLKVNFSGPLKSGQKWSWSLYNFGKRTWLEVGSNAGVTTPNTWKMLEFPISNPARFISATGKIRVMLRSSNATSDAKVDYEVLLFTTRSGTPTATPGPTSAYYVSPSGNDGNSGTQTSPWRTIQKAANTVTAGSTVIVQAGTYAERVSVTRSGTASAPITFQAQGTVVMRGFTVTANYVVINGFEISNKSQDSTNGWGIYVAGANNVIANNYIHDTTWGGIMLFVPSTNLGLSSNNLVQGNRIAHVGELGIDVRGRNNVVAYNEISGVMQYPSWMTNPPSWVDADGIHFHGSGHIIRGNYIHDILYSDPANVNPHIDCFQTFAAAPYKEPASNVILEQNHCVNAQATGAQKHGSGVMINGASGITIRNNIITAYVGVNGSYSSGLTILENTFTSDLMLPTAYNPAGITFTSVSSSTIKNNILYDMPGHLIYLVSVTGLSAGKNLEYRSDGKPLWTTSTYSHVNDLWGVNPLFVSPTDYRLQAGSPAIDAGYMVSVPTDYDGHLRPQGQGYDIGAFEK